MYIPPRRVGNGQAHSAMWSPTLPEGMSWAFRDEFDRDAIRPSWDIDNGGSFDPAAPDWYAVQVAVGPLVSLTQRPGWLLLKPENQNARHYLMQPWVIPDNFIVIARVRTVWGSANANVGAIGVMMCDIANPGVDSISTFSTYSVGLATIAESLFEKIESSVATQIDVINIGQRVPMRVGYAALQKVGSTYYSWTAASDGHFQCLNETVFAPGVAPNAFGIVFLSEVSGFPPGDILGVDFVRALESDIFPF